MSFRFKAIYMVYCSLKIDAGQPSERWADLSSLILPWLVMWSWYFSCLLSGNFARYRDLGGTEKINHSLVISATISIIRSSRIFERVKWSLHVNICCSSFGIAGSILTAFIGGCLLWCLIVYPLRWNSMGQSIIFFDFVSKIRDRCYLSSQPALF